MALLDSTNIKHDDVPVSDRLSIEKITAGGSILLSSILPSDCNEDDIITLFEALCAALEEEGSSLSESAEIHAHLNKTLEKLFLSKYIEFFAIGTPRLVMLPCDQQGKSLIRVAASKNTIKSKKKKSIKEGIKLMLMGSVLGIAIGAALLGGLYFLLLRYE
ncbi:hypothetical protein HFN20_15170 [Paenibacillus dendritiformis]|uniref:hypothetical protein n=1 Tax=Paenibacillus dendritiformis TaxID=130049 RepID=UPI00143D7C84|nr:hypothetical protein [Paenibacillus dendritiformis]NKI22542.1 hypothetical protein [Paenibacillus dendritiformis]NRF97629.1 hypothetical protein [Paenibacillus dendritiformis]